ncbi:thioredoxin family protein [Chromobacterium amazonense]|uniref:thioredoxin family protein n=1 Tax=Chromobacterium amazonense TaxID=1382803 RepID=UPI0030B8BF5C
MKKLLILLSLFLASSAALASDLPYDEKADAKAELQQTLAAARQSHQPVLLIMGANWCEDCRALDAALKSGKSAELLAREFKVVKVDVGNFDHNLDIDAAYGHPIAKGIPAAVVLSPDNQATSTPPTAIPSPRAFLRRWCCRRTTRRSTPPAPASWPTRAG